MYACPQTYDAEYYACPLSVLGLSLGTCRAAQDQLVHTLYTPTAVALCTAAAGGHPHQLALHGCHDVGLPL